MNKNKLSSVLLEKAACARIYPLGEPKSRDKICYKTNGVDYISAVCEQI